MPIPGAQFFVPPAEHEWYYKIRTPFLNGSSFTSTFIEPFSPPSDRSRGRYTLPFSPAESRIRDDPKYEIWDRRIFLDEAKQEWLFYQVPLAGRTKLSGASFAPFPSDLVSM